MNVVLYIGGAIIVLWFVGGIYRHIHGRGKIIQIIDANCTGCTRCLKTCRHKVLALKSEEKGAHVMIKNPHRCSGCGDCVSVCKFKALNLAKKIRE
jgi:NAD-dependent dihydropyrimidine dehydrogenase PreA subunit